MRHGQVLLLLCCCCCYCTKRLLMQVPRSVAHTTNRADSAPLYTPPSPPLFAAAAGEGTKHLVLRSAVPPTLLERAVQERGEDAVRGFAAVLVSLIELSGGKLTHGGWVGGWGRGLCRAAAGCCRSSSCCGTS